MWRVCELSENRSGDSSSIGTAGEPPWHRESPENPPEKKTKRTPKFLSVIVYTRAQFACGSFPSFVFFNIRMYFERANARQRRVRARPRFCVRWRVRVLSFRVNRRKPSRDLRQCLSGHGLALRSLRAASCAALPFTSLALDVLSPSVARRAFPTLSKNGFPYSAAG